MPLPAISREVPALLEETVTNVITIQVITINSLLPVELFQEHTPYDQLAIPRIGQEPNPKIAIYVIDQPPLEFEPIIRRLPSLPPHPEFPLLT